MWPFWNWFLWKNKKKIKEIRENYKQMHGLNDADLTPFDHRKIDDQIKFLSQKPVLAKVYPEPEILVDLMHDSESKLETDPDLASVFQSSFLNEESLKEMKTLEEQALAKNQDIFQINWDEQD